MAELKCETNVLAAFGEAVWILLMPISSGDFTSIKKTNLNIIQSALFTGEKIQF